MALGSRDIIVGNGTKANEMKISFFNFLSSHSRCY